ncbi:DinB family protein [Pedobacter polaris]|uniref:DinB family protein n=1 Tax=Pedobacter polaris TaxID=2571273 RepID=A0A4U1CV01_9SPHI|nr:DinB family protein [Pedobacter polaris]TKC13031.1 DinB family protein [Pedobacter polaris]
MNIAKVHQSILKVVNAYQTKLSTKGEEDFVLTPPIGGWSYSEVYSHIFDSSLLSLMALNNCIKGEGEIKPTHFGTKAVLFFGALPPGKKYIVPKRLAERVKKINLMAAQQFIVDFELQLLKLYPLVNNANPKIKVKHPRLGYLNAKQWLRFIEVHLNHHLKQLKRIENSFQLHQ